MNSFDIDETITKLSQIGSQRAKVFSDHQINSIRELVYYFPRKHLDRTNITLIRDITRGNKFNIVGKVETFGERSTRYKNFFQVVVTDGTGPVSYTHLTLPTILLV